ncbi:hypothetical protein R1sor_027571 [Riccia sorocarpa]|uniref:Reverse transcriptase domain-containing protein n=1 Tax=Riccia sorocarpa TaxID=122646 RepID=A0ABD3GEK5_9MARC
MKTNSAKERFWFCWMGLPKEIKRLQCDKSKKLQLLPGKETVLQELLKEDISLMTEIQKSLLGTAISEVRELHAYKHQRWRLTSRDKFLREGDAGTSYFFRKFRTRRLKTSVTKLKDASGTWLYNPEEIKAEVLKGYTSLYNKHTPTEEYSRNKQKLLQIEDPETLTQCTPITMFNVVYKIMAKILASRLALILPDVIPPQQQGFVKQRSTQNCISFLH